MQMTLEVPPEKMTTYHKASLESTKRAERDADLVARYRIGDMDCFDLLMQAYDEQIRRVLAQLSGTSDVDDLEQEVFLKIFRNLRDFKGDSSFYTWLYRITLNVFFDSNKKRKRADVRMNKMQEDFLDVSNIRREIEDPYTTCFERITQENLRNAIDQLPEQFKEVITMREIEDLSYGEIALKTGISTGTVRSRLSRGRNRLKMILGPSMGIVVAA